MADKKEKAQETDPRIKQKNRNLGLLLLAIALFFALLVFYRYFR